MVCKSLTIVAAAMAAMWLPCKAQDPTPIIVWDHSYGGWSNDWMFSIEGTAEGGFILSGFSDSGPAGNRTAAGYGFNDYWVVKVDAQGQMIWDRAFGGNQEDFLQVCRRAATDEFLLGGTSLSGITGNRESTNFGLRDYWIVRVDGDGNKLWDHSYGGSGSDYLQDLVQTEDGGFLLGGYSLSGMDGNKTSAPQGILDYWIVRIDSAGRAIWDQSYGGTSSDFLIQIQSQGDRGFALGGYSFSEASGNRTSPRIGDGDFWFLLVDTNGQKTFEACFGGLANEELHSMIQTSDGGLILGGNSSSGLSGNKTSTSFGSNDFWIVKLDQSGQKLWDRAYGGSGNDVLRRMCEMPDGRLILAGWSDSPADGCKASDRLGLSDFWIVATDANGNQQWDRSYGASSDELPLALQATGPSGLLLGGYSFSGIEGTKTAPNFGGNDFWLMKIIAEAPEATPRLDSIAQSITDLEANGFKFLLQGQTNRSYALEYSTNLGMWIPFTTNRLLQSQTQIIDPAATNQSGRFYRAILLP